MTEHKDTKIALVDNDKLIRKGLAALINKFDGFTVTLEADHGEDLKKKLHPLSEQELPDIILMDIEMKEMNGYKATKWLKGNLPDTPKAIHKHKEVYKNIKVAALSINEKEFSIIEMLKSGATGYLFKDLEVHELLEGLKDMKDKGYYYSRDTNTFVLNNLNVTKFHPNEQEITFLKWACTELTYKEIAVEMFLGKRRIDGIREALFEKLNVKNRVGLVIYAIQRGIYKIES